jgi:hypothetical protein
MQLTADPDAAAPEREYRRQYRAGQEVDPEYSTSTRTGAAQEFNNLPEVKNYSDALSGARRGDEGTRQRTGRPCGGLFVRQGDGPRLGRPRGRDGHGERHGEPGPASQPDDPVDHGGQAPAARSQGSPDRRRAPEDRGLEGSIRPAVSALFRARARQRLQPARDCRSPLYKSVEPIEEQYIRAHGGTPRDPNAPLNVQSSQQSEAVSASARSTQHEPEPRTGAAYDAWWKANPNPSPRQLLQFGSTIGLNIPPKNAQDIITAKKQGAGISHDVQVQARHFGRSRRQQHVGTGFDQRRRSRRWRYAFRWAFDKAVALGDTV